MKHQLSHLSFRNRFSTTQALASLYQWQDKSLKAHQTKSPSESWKSNSYSNFMCRLIFKITSTRELSIYLK